MGHCFFSLKQAISWFVSAGHENTVECMTGVREECCSQLHEAFRINPKFATPCGSCSFQSGLRGGCSRDPGCAWGRAVERSRQEVCLCGGCWCCQEKRRWLVCSGGFGATCEPLCCVSQILSFSTEERAGI